MEHVTFVTIQDSSDSTNRREFSNRQQWFTHRRLNTSNSEIDSPIVATFNVQSPTRFDKLSSRSEVNMTTKLLPVCDTLGPCRLSCTCVDSNLDRFRPLLLEVRQRRENSCRIHRFQLLVQHLLVSSSQDCEHPLHFGICAFLSSNHLCWCSSCSNSLSSSVRAFHNSNIQSNPCCCPCPYSCLVLVVLANLASLCLCPCRACLCLVNPRLCQTHRCPPGRLLLGVTNLSVSRFVLRGLHTHSMF